MNHQRREFHAPRRPRNKLTAVLVGAAGAIGFALFTGLLLLVNGTAVLVFFGALVDANPAWAERKGLIQFGLFALPLGMVVIEWLVWDFLCGLLRREGRGSGGAGRQNDPGQNDEETGQNDGGKTMGAEWRR
ncbi:hypothetical protein Mal15_07950 [Stieleria maiorica]|uniref:Uncharacterized protein n=1 Tax=Stieleria maiorica TaxID=2795974 RepID=A0A5B9MB63_9BACT|nr:hypothetical protein [Stieleria maiorica]QEF96765.1 hypothetical protein Mal15_07950 [Stieleria maiorica]